MNADFDTALRLEAIRWLTVRTNDGADPISTKELLDFEFDGERFRLMDPQRGIRKPKALDSALSIRTTFTRPGRSRMYEDAVGTDGLLRYKWRGDDPGHAENRALRAAMEAEVPLVWFFGIAEGVYQPVFPVYLLWEERDLQQFVIAPDAARGLVRLGQPLDENVRRYVVAATRRRLHQPVFRSTVLRAYAGRCAVCALRHTVLLDAAHIVADSQEAGIASVQNGMALCKIHHAAYDHHILGVRPDLVVEIRADLLDEIDGPMLRHGLQGRHGQRLMAVPHVRSQHPSPDLLEMRYADFRSAG